MTDEIKIKVPDIGGANNVDVIEILVHPGDEIDVNTSLITLESDKASMEIPSPQAGKIEKILVNIGDKVSEGDVILTLVDEDQSALEVKEDKKSSAEKNTAIKESAVIEQLSNNQVNNSKEKPSNLSEGSKLIDVVIPDIGGATDVDVIEVMIKPGDSIEKDQALITLEGDKATMDIPAPAAGSVDKVAIKVGDKVAQGTLILTLKTQGLSQNKSDDSASPESKVAPKDNENESKEVDEPSPSKAEQTKALAPNSEDSETTSDDNVFAGPAVRRMARELGVSLTKVKGTGRKGRITKEDIQAFIKAKLVEQPASGQFSLPQAPTIDFSKFGEIETKPLNKIKRLTGQNVHRSWITIPHVTQFDEADITDLEAFRKAETEAAKNTGYKLTILAFVTKVVSKALLAFPQFNASLDSTGDNLIYKKYFNIGIAVETLNGLVVPVIREVDKLSISEIARQMAEVSQRARDKGITPMDMSGGCFTISSLGGIGGTAFTPIVNSPEVAILGLSRSTIKPIYINNEFRPRLMLPLSLSYDHRVIDGAEAARFTRYIAELLSDIRRIIL
ncbi:pyruvate dehydrogenase E2 component [Legionella busanensis]|uniref:Acetyltransferase component of pyruvate dehydrogenase complex n=1 Tax=Legionella busanensis TaxID=190655 RepID=A0A378JJY8_9GAMM|nr:dihydrolipoyllysine-residue acetyltransferase [Legionella busanensis]STX51545.1 pyruvate dehydrogenase E2 component [Legionella busanensis]